MESSPAPPSCCRSRLLTLEFALLVSEDSVEELVGETDGALRVDEDDAIRCLIDSSGAALAVFVLVIHTRLDLILGLK